MARLQGNPLTRPDADLGTDSGCGPRADAAAEELRLASRSVGSGQREVVVSVPGIRCGGCIQKIERALSMLAGVEYARVNLSTKRVVLRWRSGAAPPVVAALDDLGYAAHLHDATADEADRGLSDLLRALAVAGFAAMNIMLLSVSVWSGADPATRQLFHWISAIIALPALVYSGRVFYRSAWRALKHGRTNMDVPISIGVSLAFAMSLYDTVIPGQYAYFDAAVSLLFFLLIGRTLDYMMREKARVAVKGLARIAARGALIVRADGTRAYLPVGEIERGMTILLAAGERVPVDARVERGISDLDCSLVSGESAPQAAARGALLRAGTLNLTGPLTITATASDKDSFLAEMLRLMEAAEGGRSEYRRIADRAARLYAPVVHLTAFLSFVGWLAATGDVHRAITIAIAVLIITCPCALGLAVPMVQVVAARRLFDQGIMMKDGSALERLAEVDVVVFDKTGTLTLGESRLSLPAAADPANLALAASIAGHSRHPHSRALAAAGAGRGAPAAFDGISEHAGLGLEAVSGADIFRLGRADWALGTGEGKGDRMPSDVSCTVLSKNGRLLEAFRFDDSIRADARTATRELTASKIAVAIVSGDRLGPVQQLASTLGIADVEAALLPRDKVARVASLAARGHKVLMVGDGLNDAPALAAAHVSMAPATAADVGRNAADFVFLRESLAAVPFALAAARSAGQLIRQNFGIAIAYNAIALPIAILGQVTPLVAALAMSFSSIVVVANAMRLNGGTRNGHRLRGADDRTGGRASLMTESAQ